MDLMENKRIFDWFHVSCKSSLANFISVFALEILLRVAFSRMCLRNIEFNLNALQFHSESKFSLNSMFRVFSHHLRLEVLLTFNVAVLLFSISASFLSIIFSHLQLCYYIYVFTKVAAQLLRSTYYFDTWTCVLCVYINGISFSIPSDNIF